MKKSKRSLANEKYTIVAKQHTDDLYEQGIYRCVCGRRWTEFHHAWERNSCPDEYIYDTRNFVPVCMWCHHDLHFLSKDKWDCHVQAISDLSNKIKGELENEHNDRERQEAT